MIIENMERFLPTWATILYFGEKSNWFFLNFGIVRKTKEMA